MNGIASALDAKILSTSLHHFDIEAQTCNSVAIPVDKADLESYLSALLLEIHGRPQNRLYALASQTTEFATSLNAFFWQTRSGSCARDTDTRRTTTAH